MDLDVYVMFLVGSILISFGVIVIGVAFLVINHLYVKYWQTVRLFKIYSFEQPHFQYVEPTVENPANTANTAVTTNATN
jgi:hypothetical protein